MYCFGVTQHLYVIGHFKYQLVPFSVDVSGTPFQYVGVGYNVLAGNPELLEDPGFLLNKRVLQVPFHFTISSWM